MLSSNTIESTVSDRFAFIETLSGEFLSRTGCGVYVFLNPVAIEQLFETFSRGDTPILAFARQCVRNTVH